MSIRNQKILFIPIIIFIAIIGLFIFYFQTKKTHTKDELTSLPSSAPTQRQQQGADGQLPIHEVPTVKTYAITIFQDMLSPAGMMVNPTDKLEFELKNSTEAEAIFKTNQDLGITEDITLQSKEEKSLSLTAPAESGEYKFHIATSQGELAGLLIIKNK